MRKRLANGALSAIGLLASCSSGGSTPPSVVVIVVDTLRADHLSQYGYSRETSRALEGFASRATRFLSCHAPASWTAPSTASLFTGLLPARHGTDFRGAALPEVAFTLAEHVRSAGWTTLGISYNHNVTATTRFDQGFDYFEGTEGESGVYPDIRNMRRNLGHLVRSASRPFFLYLQPMNVHGPYRTPEGHRADLLGHEPSPEFEYSESLMKSIMKKGKLDRRAEVTDAYLQSHEDQYDTAVRYSMDRIAEILEDLRELGCYDEALVVLTSDHGEELYDHQGFGHGYTLHEELLRVPLWIKLPHQRRARVVEQRVSLVDLLPTVLEIVGLTVPEDLDGRSLARLLRDGEDPLLGSRPFFFETRWPGRIEGEGVLVHPWKLIRIERDYAGRRNHVALYQLAADPAERTNVAAERPDVVERLTKVLLTWRASVRALPAAEDVTSRMNAETLEALGYAK